MPWILGPHAGFCPPEAEPWLPLVADADHLAVAADPPALRLHRRLLALRRAEPALALGDWQPLQAADGVLAFVRGAAILVALNLTAEERALELGERAGEVVLSARGLADGQRVDDRVRLAPDDALVVRLS
jgi:alpha-glucosidase